MRRWVPPALRLGLFTYEIIYLNRVGRWALLACADSAWQVPLQMTVGAPAPPCPRRVSSIPPYGFWAETTTDGIGTVYL
jgi:hypothetical protein